MSCDKENEVTNETTTTQKRELREFLETLKSVLREFQTECMRDREFLTLAEDQEETLRYTTNTASRAAALLQGVRGSDDEILKQGLEVLGKGDWQKYFEEKKLGSTQNYGYEELKRLANVTELDEELTTLIDNFLPIWESNTSLLPCEYSKLLIFLRKKRKLFEKRILTCISIIRRLSKSSQGASVKLDELKIRWKKLELDWNRHRKNELESIEQHREKKQRQKEKEEQRLKKELERRERNAEKEKQKKERWNRIQQREDKKRIMEEQKERRKMETEAEKQAIHRQAAVLENFIKNAPKLPLFQGINRRLASISDELQQQTIEESKPVDNKELRDLIISVKHIRKQVWKRLGIKYVSFGQCRGNRVKLLQFEGSCRPPFHGVVQEPSKLPNGRKPLIRLPWLDYDYDSEIEWVESEPGENISESASEDSDSLMDVECSSSSDEDSFLIDDERNANQNGLNAYFPLQEELVGITCCSDPNNTQHYILSKFPRKQISNVKIGNSTCLLLGSADGFPNKSGSILDDRSVQVSEMRENLKPLEEWWQIQEKSKDQLSRVDSSVTANVSVKHDSSSSAFACLQTDILQEFHQYLLEMVLSNSQNCDVAYVRRRFSFLFCPITSLAVIQNMHLETPTLMMKTCLLRQQQQEWPILMASCLFCIIQTLQSNLESIHIGTIEELKTTKKLVEEFLSLEIFNTAIIKAFRTLKDKIENVTCE